MTSLKTIGNGSRILVSEMEDSKSILITLDPKDAETILGYGGRAGLHYHTFKTNGDRKYMMFYDFDNCQTANWPLPERITIITKKMVIAFRVNPSEEKPDLGVIPDWIKSHYVCEPCLSYDLGCELWPAKCRKRWKYVGEMTKVEGWVFTEEEKTAVEMAMDSIIENVGKISSEKITLTNVGIGYSRVFNVSVNYDIQSIEIKDASGKTEYLNKRLE